MFGTELCSLVDNLWNDGDYDVVSVSSTSALNEIVSAAVLVSWWKNNSFTTAAIEADELFARLKKQGE